LNTFCSLQINLKRKYDVQKKTVEVFVDSIGTFHESAAKQRSCICIPNCVEISLAIRKGYVPENSQTASNKTSILGSN
jgi:hypothetical protein